MDPPGNWQKEMRKPQGPWNLEATMQNRNHPSDLKELWPPQGPKDGKGSQKDKISKGPPLGKSQNMDCESSQSYKQFS